MVWYSHHFKNFPQFVVIHTVKSFHIVNETEIDVFLGFPCFFYDPVYVGNLIAGSAFYKSKSYIWKLTVHILLKPTLKDFEHFALLPCEMSTIVQKFEHSLTLSFFGIEMKTDIFQSCGHWCVLQICLHLECSTFIESSFRIWNSSAGILSLLLLFFFLNSITSN